MRRSAQSGFTLVEMMAVVGIVAIITTLALPYVWPKTRPVDAAARFANLVESASRIAVRDGVVTSATAVAEGSKRRTRIRGNAGPPVAFTLEVLSQEAPSVEWTTVETLVIPPSVTSDSFAMAVGTHAALTASLETDWSTFELSCFPNGTCSAATLFFSGRGSSSVKNGRVSVLPLGAATFVRSAW